MLDHRLHFHKVALGSGLIGLGNPKQQPGLGTHFRACVSFSKRMKGR